MKEQKQEHKKTESDIVDRFQFEVEDFLKSLFIVMVAYFLLSFLMGTTQIISVVRSESMVPTLLVGDVIIIKAVNVSTLNTGDIIVYDPRDYRFNQPIVHRLVNISSDFQGKLYFTTKGDNNQEQLPFESRIGEDRVIGKLLVRVPYVGWARIILDPVLNPLSELVLGVIRAARGTLP